MYRTNALDAGCWSDGFDAGCRLVNQTCIHSFLLAVAIRWQRFGHNLLIQLYPNACCSPQIYYVERPHAFLQHLFVADPNFSAQRCFVYMKSAQKLSFMQQNLLSPRFFELNLKHDSKKNCWSVIFFPIVCCFHPCRNPAGGCGIGGIGGKGWAGSAIAEVS